MRRSAAVSARHSPASGWSITAFFAALSPPCESGVAAGRRATIASLGRAKLHDRKDSPPFHATAC